MSVEYEIRNSWLQLQLLMHFLFAVFKYQIDVSSRMMWGDFKLGVDVVVGSR